MHGEVLCTSNYSITYNTCSSYQSASCRSVCNLFVLLYYLFEHVSRSGVHCVYCLRDETLEFKFQWNVCQRANRFRRLPLRLVSLCDENISERVRHLFCWFVLLGAITSTIYRVFVFHLCTLNFLNFMQWYLVLCEENCCVYFSYANAPGSILFGLK